jgi:hypothetical protein
MAKFCLDERVLEFITADREGISADWKKLADFKDEQGYEGKYFFDQVSDNLIDFLVKTGILVTQYKKDSFAVIGEGVNGGNVGPAYSVAGINFNFKSLEYVEAYKEHAGRFYGKAVLPAKIVQVKE